MLTDTPTAKWRSAFGVEEQRARTLLAGALILSGLQELLGVPFEVVRGGLRDGALAELAAAPRSRLSTAPSENRSVRESTPPVSRAELRHAPTTHPRSGPHMQGATRGTA